MSLLELEAAAEALACRFHHYKSTFGHDFGRADGDPDWQNLAENQRQQTVAALRIALIDLTTTSAAVDNDPNVFSGPHGGQEGKECGC